MSLNRLQGDASLCTTVASLVLPPRKMVQLFSTDFFVPSSPDAGSFSDLARTAPFQPLDPETLRSATSYILELNQRSFLRSVEKNDAQDCLSGLRWQKLCWVSFKSRSEKCCGKRGSGVIFAYALGKYSHPASGATQQGPWLQDEGFGEQFRWERGGSHKFTKVEDVVQGHGHGRNRNINSLSTSFWRVWFFGNSTSTGPNKVQKCPLNHAVDGCDFKYPQSLAAVHGTFVGANHEVEPSIWFHRSHRHCLARVRCTWVCLRVWGKATKSHWFTTMINRYEWIPLAW